MVTIRDIAAQLNLSPATVSRALNNDTKINVLTRERVNALAAELGYAGAAGRKKRQSEKVVGVICPEIVSENYSSVVEAIKNGLERKGYSCIFQITNMDAQSEKDSLYLLTRLNVAGIIVIAFDDASTEELLHTFRKEHSVPVVQIFSISACREYDSLEISNHLASKIIVDHLFELGHRSVAVISDGMAKNRKESICSCLEEKGISPKKQWVVEVTDSRFEECGYQAACELLKLSNRPTAVIATYDYIAIGAMKAFYDNGIRVPEDISVAGIDNINASQYTYKGLTTVSMPHADQGQIASRILVDRIQNDKGQVAIQHVSLNPELVIRQSTAPIASE